MSVAMLSIILGVLLMLLLIELLLRSKATEHDSVESIKIAIPGEIAPELTERLFGLDDWNFIRTQCSEHLQRMFFRQRRDLALFWMHELRARNIRLMRLHRMAARASSQLEPLAEIRVSVDYLLFLVLWQLFVITIWLRGPMAMHGAVAHIRSLSGRLSDATAKLVTTEGEPAQ
jgi:hypothetical protein